MAAQVLIGGTSSVLLPAVIAISLGLVGHKLFDRRQCRNQTFNSAGNVAAAVASLGHGRYLVGGIITGSIDGGSGLASFLATNAALSATYGPRYVDLLGALQAANDGSANDLSDIAAGWVPRSLRSDPVHLNDAGYAVVAAQFKAKTLAMGW